MNEGMNLREIRKKLKTDIAEKLKKSLCYIRGQKHFPII